MQELILLGTGVHGAEMAHIVERINRQAPTWKLLGHVAPKVTDKKEWAGSPILGWAGELEEILAEHPLAGVVADNEFPKSVQVPPERLVNLVDPSCFVHPAARLGRGCVLYPHCFVGLNAVLGDRVFVLAGCIINHDVVLADRVVLGSNVALAGCVHVEAGAYLGQSCSVRQYLRIGREAFIGMGAIVIKDVEPGCVMIGNPARLLRKNEPKPKIGERK